MTPVRLLGVVLAGLAAVPGAVPAGQPFSESLVDCAAIHEMLHDRLEQVSTGRREADLAKLRDYSERLFLGAIDQSGKEGHDDPFLHVSQLLKDKRQTWGQQGLLWIVTEDGKDWISYCRNFSRHLGIEPPRIN